MLRTARAAPAGMDRGRLRVDGGEGARVPAAVASTPATRSTRRRCRCSSASGSRCRNTSRRAARWRCWRSGSRSTAQEAFTQGAHRTADHPRFGAAGGARLPQRRARPARRVATDRGDRERTSPATRPRQGARRRHQGALRDIHRRVGTAILFESSGGQTDKVAHLPELRFALGEPQMDTTTIDTAAFALEDRSYFVRKVGSDGFRIGYQPTMKKVVSDRRASLDEETEIKPAVRKLVEEEFRRTASIPVVAFPQDGAGDPDTPRLTLVVADPEEEWSGNGTLRTHIAEWTRNRGKSPRLYPGAIVWCLKKSGRDLREKVELVLAWKRVAREVTDGTLGGEFDRSDKAELQSKVKDADEAARKRFGGTTCIAIIADSQEHDGLKVIDLGGEHSSGDEETLWRPRPDGPQVGCSSQRIRGMGASAQMASALDCRTWPLAASAKAPSTDD